MKLKNTIILLLFAGAIFAFIKFYESEQPGTREAQEKAGRVVNFDRDQIDTIQIKNTEEKIELHRGDNGDWYLREPVKDRADSMAISQLFTSAEALRYDAMISGEKNGLDKEQLREYGVANSETKVKFSNKDRTIELLFGKDAAVEGKVYVKLEGTNAVYVIDRDLKEQISKRADEFRDRRLTELNATQVKRFTIKTNAGEMELERKDQHWMLTKPLRARGDESKIGDLISQAVTAHIRRFVADSANASNYGLQDSRVTISLEVEGIEKPVVFQIGTSSADKQDKESVYAKVSTRDAVVLLPKSIETLIEVEPNDLRDRNLVRIEPDIVDRIEISGANSDPIVLARSGESWVRKDGAKDVAVNVGNARRILDEVRFVQVMDFVADVATELPKYGLDQPQVKLSFSSYASENTAETKAGEKLIVAIHFGKEENGNVFAKVEDEPFVVLIPRAILDVLMTDSIQWRPLEVYSNKSKDIVNLEIIRDGQPPITLERAKDGNWILAKGDGLVNQVNVQSLVNTLANLRAVRWIGPTVSEHELENARISAAFKTTGDSSGRLKIGAVAPSDLSYAITEGTSGTFVLSRPDVTAFELPLIDKAASTATPPTNGLPPASTPGPATDLGK